MDASARPELTTSRADSKLITCYVPASVDLDLVPDAPPRPGVRFMDLIHRKRVFFRRTRWLGAAETGRTSAWSLAVMRSLTCSAS